MRIKCDSCYKEFERDEGDWRGFINEAKADGWIFVKAGNDWYRYCSLDCKNVSED